MILYQSLLCIATKMYDNYLLPQISVSLNYVGTTIQALLEAKFEKRNVHWFALFESTQFRA